MTENEDRGAVMNKKKIAVFFGGHSSEYEVSLQSAHAVLENIDAETYEAIPIGITKAGEWYRYTGEISNIAAGTWCEDTAHLHDVVFSQNRSCRGFWENDNGWRMHRIDLAFPVLHGKNGEDGTVQGMLELAGIPIVGCGTLCSALCMDKDRAHRLVGLAGVSVPKAVAFPKTRAASAIEEIDRTLRYPIFVKPLRGGSSIGMTKVNVKSELEEAVHLAFCYDSEAIAEEAVDGFEVGCAVMGIDELTVGRADEIELSRGFFDYTEKYTLKTSRIHMPARVDQQMEMRILETAKVIYRALGCSGFARVDMFLRPDGELVFNEVNTIPGLTAHSRFPNMMKGAGLSFGQMLNKLLGLYAGGESDDESTEM